MTPAKTDVGSVSFHATDMLPNRLENRQNDWSSTNRAWGKENL
jgi:hypothetical protein